MKSRGLPSAQRRSWARRSIPKVINVVTVYNPVHSFYCSSVFVEDCTDLVRRTFTSGSKTYVEKVYFRHALLLDYRPLARQ